MSQLKQESPQNTIEDKNFEQRNPKQPGGEHSNKRNFENIIS